MISLSQGLFLQQHSLDLDSSTAYSGIGNMADQSADDSKDPASFLSSIIGVPVTVKLNSGVVYKGELQSVDGYMNIALEKCQEFVNGKLRRTYGDAFVRGNNGKIPAWCPLLSNPATVLYISSE